MTDRRRCGFTIEGPPGNLARNRPRRWWRRQCKRLAVPGHTRCWQHAYNGDTDDSVPPAT